MAQLLLMAVMLLGRSPAAMPVTTPCATVAVSAAEPRGRAPAAPIDPAEDGDDDGGVVLVDGPPLLAPPAARSISERDEPLLPPALTDPCRLFRPPRPTA